MGGLREGFTTGACAAAAAKAAVTLLEKGEEMEKVEIAFPDGSRATFKVINIKMHKYGASATVVKDAGDDPDVTNGMSIKTVVSPLEDGAIKFVAGDGVGTVTKKGLSLPIGEPAINRVPRKMIENALREVSSKPLKVTVFIEGGVEIAKKTFNPRLGIEDGLSVLGTTGIVRPYSHPAIQQSLKCVLDVAIASGINSPLFTAGNIGTRSAKALGIPKEKIIEVGNEWGFMLGSLLRHDIKSLLAVGHPGKLTKLIAGDWDTHSSRSKSALPTVCSIYKELFGREPEDSTTVEGLFAEMNENEAKTLGRELAARIADAIKGKIKNRFSVTVALVTMNEDLIGQHGDMEQWKSR